MYNVYAYITIDKPYIQQLYTYICRNMFDVRYTYTQIIIILQHLANDA